MNGEGSIHKKLPPIHSQHLPQQSQVVNSNEGASDAALSMNEERMKQFAQVMVRALNVQSSHICFQKFVEKFTRVNSTTFEQTNFVVFALTIMDGLRSPGETINKHNISKPYIAL